MGRKQIYVTENLGVIRARSRRQFAGLRLVRRNYRHGSRCAALSAGLPLGAGHRILRQSPVPRRLPLPSAARGRGPLTGKRAPATPSAAICPAPVIAGPAPPLLALVIDRDRLEFAAAVVIGPFVGLDPISAVQPTAQIDVGATRRAERPVACDRRLAADRAATAAGGQASDAMIGVALWHARRYRLTPPQCQKVERNRPAAP